MIVALLILAGFAVAFVLMLVDINELIAEAGQIAEEEFLESLWDDSHDDGGRASSDRVKATTPAAVLHLVDGRQE